MHRNLRFIPLVAFMWLLAASFNDLREVAAVGEPAFAGFQLLDTGNRFPRFVGAEPVRNQKPAVRLFRPTNVERQPFMTADILAGVSAAARVVGLVGPK